MMDFRQDILGVKNATRNMSNEDFNANLDWMAHELAEVDYHYHYDDNTLQKAWKNLCSYTTTAHYTASQMRKGLELCEHFFPNFFDIENKKGESFKSYWNAEALKKVIKWNRTSHSTPYLSEFRRGIYFCYGLTKNTMFRPHLAKMICDFYKPTVVLDPCCGWGGRLLGVVASGATYVGFEPNTETYKHLVELVDYLQISKQVLLFNEPAETIKSHTIMADLVLTSPPYYDLEIYSHEPTQSHTNFNSYKEWIQGWLTPVIRDCLDTLHPKGISCWNVSPKMRDDIKLIHNELGWQYNSDFGLQSSARQANQNAEGDKKTKDITICYSKI